ncbi:MAG: ATP-binding protein [Verrucomicrobiota bacterium]
MTPLFKSIRWRLQAWHGLMLLVVLMAFGVTAYYLVFDNRMRRVDQELQKRTFPIVGRLSGPQPGDRGRFRMGPPPDESRPPGERRDERPPPPPDGKADESPRSEGPRNDGPDFTRRADEPRPDGARVEVRRFEGFRPPFFENFPLSPDSPRMFEEAGYYVVVWTPEKAEMRRSTNAPAIVPLPPITPALTNGTAWTRQGFREYAQISRRGNVVLVGHDITPDLAELTRLAFGLTAAACGVLALGLAGGWWLSTRAIRPIEDISQTAVKIANGDLDQRINVTDADSELGQLARVLNNTFDRLKSAFARQVQFTADASHELRTPVSVILSQTQTTLKRERTPAEYQETIVSCQRAAQRMRQLVEALLILARQDSGDAAPRREPCELDRVVTDAVDLLRPLAVERNVSLQTDLKPTPFIGDAQLLGQVATNLISNAIYYNRPGGNVTVQLAPEADGAKLVVSDTGQGIAAEDLPHIFERFYRADKSRTAPDNHTGLGLAIVKGIVEAHAGKVTVTSEPGKGSVFTVILPASGVGTASSPVPDRCN